MRIGINLLYLLPGVVGGTETYAAGLLRGLANTDREDEFVVFVNREASEWPIPDAPNIQRVVCPVWSTSRLRRYWFEQVHLPELLRTHRVDVLHSLGYVSPVFCRPKRVVTIPDLNFIAMGRRMSLPRRIALAMVVTFSAWRAKRIVTLSEFSRQAILSAYGFRHQRVVLTHLAPSIFEEALSPADAAAALERMGLSQPYIVAFSSTSPHKNIQRLIKAYCTARAEYPLPHHLVLVGHLPVADMAESLPPGAVATGWLEPGDMRAALSAADLLVFPSEYEGFGLPVLEAMQLGTPVVCSRAASLPEIVGEAALLFDPENVQEMADRLAEVALSPTLQAELRRKGRENFQRFSWDETAAKTVAVYRELLDSGGHGSETS